MTQSKNYSELSIEQLKVELEELMKEGFTLRIQKVTGQATKTHLISQARANVARVKTALAAKGVKL